MKLTASQETVIQQQFDSFCKKILREEARDYIRSLKRHADHEVPFENLTEDQYICFSCSDDYPSDFSSFIVLGQIFYIRNQRLADAIATLPRDRQEIILLSYFWGMTDREIAQRLNMVRSTVQYKRKESLKAIKLEMEGEP